MIVYRSPSVKFQFPNFVPTMTLQILGSFQTNLSNSRLHVILDLFRWCFPSFFHTILRILPRPPPPSPFSPEYISSCVVFFFRFSSCLLHPCTLPPPSFGPSLLPLFLSYIFFFRFTHTHGLQSNGIQWRDAEMSIFSTNTALSPPPFSQYNTQKLFGWWERRGVVLRRG